MASKYEETLARLIQLAGITPPIRQYAFAKPLREYKADFAWPHVNLLVEVDGGSFVGRGGDGAVVSRTTAVGYHQTIADYRKRNLANLLGFTLLSYQPGQFTEAITEIKLWLQFSPPAVETGLSVDVLEHHVGQLAENDKTRRLIAARKTEARKARNHFLGADHRLHRG